MDLVVFDPNPSRGRLKKVERVDVELVGWMGYQLVEQLKPGLIEVIEESGGNKQFFRTSQAAGRTRGGHGS